MAVVGIDAVTIDVIVEHSSGDENTILTTATSIGQVRVIEQDGSVRAEIDVNGDVTVTDTLPLPRLEDGSLGGSVGFSLDADSGELVAVILNNDVIVCIVAIVVEVVVLFVENAFWIGPRNWMLCSPDAKCSNN